MARHKKLIQKYIGFPLFHTETNAFTFPLTHTFTKDFSGLDNLALDLQFATDKTLTARKGPTPVFTRASGATQVGASGLIEFAPENTIQRSEEFDNATYWSPTRATITANATTSPTGTLTADKLVTDSTATNNHRIDRSTLNLSLSTVYTLSIYVKASEYSGFAIGVDSSSPVLGVQFSLSGSGSITAQLAGYTGTIQDAGNGWFRCSATFTSSASIVAHRVYMYLGQNGTTFTYTGDGTSGIFIWGAQLERYASARTYIPTTTADIFNARFDHDPITLACKGLLIEESRTNLITNSGNALLWPSTGTDEGSLTAPDGSSNGKLVGVGTAGITTSSVSATAIAYSFSVFVKRNNTDWFRLQLNHAINTNAANAWFNLATGSTGSVSVGIGSFASLSSAIVPLGNGWYRCIIIGTPPSSGSLTGNIISATGDSSVTRVTGSKYGIWGGQVEAGAFPTSYIPTTTASVVRSADVCSITGSDFTSFYNQNEGTIFVSGDPRASATGIGSYVMANSGSNANQVSIYRNSTTNFYGVANSGSYTANIQFASSNGSFNKIAGSYITNDARVAFNNVLGTPDTSVIVPTNLIRLNIGSSVVASSEYTNGCIASIRYYKKRLPNAKLQTLTA